MSAINHFIKKGVRQAEIDEYLSAELSKAGYGGVEITKTPLGESIIIYASKPGVVIGRRGKTIRAITADLVVRFGFDDPKIDVQEVKDPELNPKVMAYSLVSAIERGVHRRRAAYSALRRIINAGAKGVEIIIAGKLTSKRSRHEAYRMGLVAKSGEVASSYVNTANAIAVMKLGTIGVTVSIMRGDLPLPDEIEVLSVNLDAPEEEMVVEVTEVEAEKPVAKKPKEEVKADEKKPEKEPAKKPKEPAAKKTDLDKKVEELSDLIEKTPGEEKKAKPKTPAKAVKKETPKATPKKTPAKAKTTSTTKKKVTKEEPKTKTTTKKEPKKEEPAVKKSTTKKSTTTKKAEPAKKTSTTKKTTTAKKKDEKTSAKTKAASSKSKTTSKKETKSKSEKDSKKKKEK